MEGAFMGHAQEPLQGVTPFTLGGPVQKLVAFGPA